ncbi:hypothetical protein K0M31_002383 [Melipona bicolor]|uniref:Ig-like domain-containing protein n=1 Tax=Melipona bicolor TaxID=60889 RepID=A0AA40GI32_9HYME|nr:hypothetical protein K0M31_002383 [Melipona bicolor]
MGTSGAISRLYIANANKKDSGNYSCALADVAAATTVSVHVLNVVSLEHYKTLKQESPLAMPRYTCLETKTVGRRSFLARFAWISGFAMSNREKVARRGRRKDRWPSQKIGRSPEETLEQWGNITYVMHGVTNGHSECVVKTMSILFSKYNNAAWAS